MEDVQRYFLFLFTMLMCKKMMNYFGDVEKDIISLF